MTKHWRNTLVFITVGGVKAPLFFLPSIRGTSIGYPGTCQDRKSKGPYFMNTLLTLHHSTFDLAPLVDHTSRYDTLHFPRGFPLPVGKYMRQTSSYFCILFVCPRSSVRSSVDDADTLPVGNSMDPALQVTSDLLYYRLIIQ